MSVTIERALGRERLIAAMCERTPLLGTCNEAARMLNAQAAALVVWDDAAVEGLGRQKDGRLARPQRCRR